MIEDLVMILLEKEYCASKEDPVISFENISESGFIKSILEIIRPRDKKEVSMFVKDFIRNNYSFF